MESDTVTNEVLAGLVRNLADVVVIADVNGTIVFWNDAATRLFGWPASEALGQTLDLIIPERLRERHWSGFNDVMATGHTSNGDRLLEVPALHADGRRMSIAFTVTLVQGSEDESPTAIAAVLRDDTERWQERRQMREEMARMRDDSGDSAESAEGS